MRIFISYAKKYRARPDSRFDPLIEFLEDAHQPTAPRLEVCWFDAGLAKTAGQRWWKKICDEIRGCDVFLYVGSPETLASRWCDRERIFAAALGKNSITVLMDDIRYDDQPLWMKQSTCAVFTTGSREQKNNLKLAIRDLPPNPTPPNILDPKSPYDQIEAIRDQLDSSELIASAQRTIRDQIENLWHDFRRENDTFLDSELIRLIDYFADRPYTSREMIDRLTRLKQQITNEDTPASTPPRIAVVQPPPVQTPRLPTSLDLMPTPFEWIDIPAGTVTLVDEHNDAYFGKKGQKVPFTVPKFAIARYPVTNAQFRKFVESDGYQNDAYWTANGLAARSAQNWTEPRYWQDEKWNGDHYPVVGVSWYEADAFCQWLNAKTGEYIDLPTEQQWQRAAQGDTGWAYPWGNEFDGSKCTSSVMPYDFNQTTPVTQYAGNDRDRKGDSPFGVSDLSGNVWEWCATDYESEETDRNKNTNICVLRGGSWFDSDPSYFRADYRDWFSPDFGDDSFGFRLVRSLS